MRLFLMFNETVDVFGARPPKEIEIFVAPDRAQPTNRPRSGKFLGYGTSGGHFLDRKWTVIREVVWTKVVVLAELCMNL